MPPSLAAKMAAVRSSFFPSFFLLRHFLFVPSASKRSH